MINRITDLLGVGYPIFQGPMTWVSDEKLTAAVSNTGCFGTLSTGNMPPETLRELIRNTRKLTDKPFGVNLILLVPDFEKRLQVVMEEKPEVVTFGAGNPGKYIEPLKKLGITVIPVVPSVALALRAERAGADALIAEGQEAGGHIGNTATLPMIPQIVDAVNIPVIAAGGIADGRGIAAAFALGAEGAQLGTRFIVADECWAHDNYKNAVINANDRATAVTGMAIKAPVRALRNRLTKEFYELEFKGASRDEVESLAVGKLREAVTEGNVESGSVMMGQCAGIVNKRQTVKEIVDELITQTDEVFRKMGMLSFSNGLLAYSVKKQEEYA
ncbi:nitronate monooxygenase [candidate division KSB1 bacterium]